MTSAGKSEVSPPLTSAKILVSDDGSTQNEQTSRKVVSRYRMSLDWMIRIPQFEPLFEPALKALELPLPRQGISLRGVMDALPLENKKDLLLRAIEQYRENDFPSKIVLQLSERFAIKFFGNNELDDKLTRIQWQIFADKLRYQISRDHLQYKRAQTFLFTKYQPLAERMVQRLVFDAGKRLDATQEAHLALIHAIDKADDSTASFGSYAFSRIARQIKKFLLSEHFPVYVPTNHALRLIDEKKREAEANTSTETQGTGISADANQESMLLSDESLETPLESLSRKDMCDHVERCLQRLSPKQREVLMQRFGIGKAGDGDTLASIALRYGISHQQVSMREKRAIQQLETKLRPLFIEYTF